MRLRGRGWGRGMAGAESALQKDEAQVQGVWSGIHKQGLHITACGQQSVGNTVWLL